MQWAKVESLSDEFDGNKLDTSKWRPFLTYWKGREPSEFSRENVSVSDGKLCLRSVSKVQDLLDVKNPEKDVWVASACVSSVRAVAFYGYYEVRMKASKLSMTSSFWLQGRFSEIDVVEQMGASVKNPQNGHLMVMNSHSFKNGWVNDQATPQTWKMTENSAERFHRYGVWWKNDSTLWFYHDGVKVAEMKPHAAFTEPMLLIFDTEVFVWDGLPTMESLKDPKCNTMEVDWLRSWKLTPGK